jgi:hypothetical protein
LQEKARFGPQKGTKSAIIPTKPANSQIETMAKTTSRTAKESSKTLILIGEFGQAPIRDWHSLAN